MAHLLLPLYRAIRRGNSLKFPDDYRWDHDAIFDDDPLFLAYLLRGGKVTATRGGKVTATKSGEHREYK